MVIIIETKDLILRKITLADADTLHEIHNEENILKWMPDWKSLKEETINWIKEVSDFYDKQTEEDLWCQLAIERKVDKKVMGLIALQSKYEVNNEIEIAYFISKKYSGHGYMKQSAKAILDWGFKNFKLPFVMAIVDIGNYPSQKIIEHAGFKIIETKLIINAGEEKEKPFYYYRRERI